VSNTWVERLCAWIHRWRFFYIHAHSHVHALILIHMNKNTVLSLRPCAPLPHNTRNSSLDIDPNDGIVASTSPHAGRSTETPPIQSIFGGTLITAQHQQYWTPASWWNICQRITRTHKKRIPFPLNNAHHVVCAYPSYRRTNELRLLPHTKYVQRETVNFLRYNYAD